MPKIAPPLTAPHWIMDPLVAARFKCMYKLITDSSHVASCRWADVANTSVLCCLPEVVVPKEMQKCLSASILLRRGYRGISAIKKTDCIFTGMHSSPGIRCDICGLQNVEMLECHMCAALKCSNVLYCYCCYYRLLVYLFLRRVIFGCGLLKHDECQVSIPVYIT